MKKLTLADVIDFLPKNAIIINDAFYSDKTQLSGALVSSILKYDKYKDYLKKTVIAMNAVPYKTKAAISVTFAPTAKATTKKTASEK
mgnify:FL=1